MQSRLITAVAAAAALSSGLSVTLAQALTASATPAAVPAAASTTSETNKLLSAINHNIAVGDNRLSDLETKVHITNTYIAAAANKIYVTNKLLATAFAYQDPRTGSYVGSELHLIETTLCTINFWTEAETRGDAPSAKLPPCGN